jgi:hypothetical protein
VVALAKENVVALADRLAMVRFGVRFLVLFLCSIKGLLLVWYRVGERVDV